MKENEELWTISFHKRKNIFFLKAMKYHLATKLNQDDVNLNSQINLNNPTKTLKQMFRCNLKIRLDIMHLHL